MVGNQQKNPQSSFQGGFTLAELAVVILVFSIMLGGLFATLSTNIERDRVTETKRILADAREALLGFAVRNGRIPCPAAPNGNGVESHTAVTGVCTNPFDGFYPGATLGITPVNRYGYLVDAWGNPVRYAVTTNQGVPDLAGTGAPPCATPCFTTTGQIKSLLNVVAAQPSLPYPTIPSRAALNPDLYVCASAGNPAGNPCYPMTTGPNALCNAACALAFSPVVVGDPHPVGAVAVIFSTGKNAAFGGTGDDESKNLDADRAFVFHEQRAAGEVGGEFDDLMVWLGRSELYGVLIKANVL